jgi:hypothetical protein
MYKIAGVKNKKVDRVFAVVSTKKEAEKIRGQLEEARLDVVEQYPIAKKQHYKVKILKVK